MTLLPALRSSGADRPDAVRVAGRTRPAPPGSPGPLPGVETRILDREDQPVAADGESVGELSIRGRLCSAGTSTGGSGAPTPPGGTPPATWPPWRRTARTG
ncbi:hypothetical protein [Micromonospora sp. KC207]|uniref:hypothetical protein n=1 Tax=Micromonospora sp. KC207 TaxID=2530377 RepID=UPI001FB65FEF|nr:hypothetical protein [Micromonospora sp. KC207]